MIVWVTYTVAGTPCEEVLTLNQTDRLELGCNRIASGIQAACRKIIYEISDFKVASLMEKPRFMAPSANNIAVRMQRAGWVPMMMVITMATTACVRVCVFACVTLDTIFAYHNRRTSWPSLYSSFSPSNASHTNHNFPVCFTIYQSTSVLKNIQTPN